MGASKPATSKRTASKRGLRLGIAGRVVLIACAAAVVATLAQWIATPILLRNEYGKLRHKAVFTVADTMAKAVRNDMGPDGARDRTTLTGAVAAAVPEGVAALYDGSGALLTSSGGPGAVPARIEGAVEAMRAQKGGAVAAAPVVVDGETVGTSLVWMRPRNVLESWWGILWRNALVLVLAIGVIAPFLLPLAKRALSPMVELERKIRARSASDRTRLAEEIDDPMLTPLLDAIDEAHARSDQATRKALHMAFADPVTRLPNRLRFVSRMDSVLERAGERVVHLLICDLDGFRKINVAHGPRVADMVLAKVAERLRDAALSVSKEGLFVGRLSADQFAVLATVQDAGVVARFLEAADAALSEPMSIEENELRITAAFGAAVYPCDARLSQDLLKQAEIALKEAKRSMTSRRVYFDQRLLEAAHRQQKLEQDVRDGVERNEFVAVFQPKVHLETGELVGAEALARWRRPDGAIVSPGVFVPIAEELGLISKLGVSVMRDACFAAAGWQRDGIGCRVAVNVSPHQFHDPEFTNQVYAALGDSGLDPKQLELEITESAAVSEPERVARIMWPLRNRGVRLAIDDFGTGHSNFTSITRLPFDVFKIDQQFIRALSTDPNAPAIVEMILAMAEALGQETVAEGVETREQADFLLRRACAVGQGYYFSPPLPADEFDAFVRSWTPRPASRFAA
jgi:diguanylate cyclase (GGDEF)-like protein